MVRRSKGEKMARQKDQQKTEVVQVRVSSRVYRGLKRRSKAAGVSMAEMVRRYLMDNIDKCPTCGK